MGLLSVLKTWPIRKNAFFDEDLLAIVDEKQTRVEVYQLVDLVYSSGTKVTPKATVTVKKQGKTIKQESSGDGPVDACYKAIDAITKTKATLLDYAIHAVTEGEDAQGEVSVKLEIKGTPYSGRGASTDIIEASAKAYLNAINVALTQPVQSSVTKGARHGV
jgi:2-isopropylmalate synthase